jgi:signal transduction histidine kinase
MTLAGWTLASLWRGSLARRLVVLAAIWSVPLVVFAGVAQTALFHQASVSRLDEDLFEIANGLYSQSTIDDQGLVDAPPLTDPGAMRAYSGDYWEIAEPAGDRLHSLVRSRSLWDGDLKGPPEGVAPLQASAGKPYFYDIAGADGPNHQPLRAVAILSHLPGRSAPVVFMAAEDRTALENDAERFAVETAVFLAVLMAVLILPMWIQVRVGLQPLFDLRREVADVRTGKADQLKGDYPSELKPLAEELNALVEHDREVVERQRTHVGNLAHALKTPLSVMLAEAERHPGALADVVERQATSMRGQVDHHLRRARAAARSQGRGERTPVGEVLEELTLTLERIFRDREVEIDWRAPDELVFLGERQDLLEMAGNVMENACRYSRGRVRATAAISGPGRFTLTVEDNGPGLPGAARAEAIKRGARLDETEPGSGLGLAIVDELARAYGGLLSLSDSSLGGLGVRLELPGADG